MGHTRLSVRFDPEGLCVVVPRHVDAEAIEHIGDIAGKAGGFTPMGCLILSELAIHVVGAEEGIVPGARFGGVHGQMHQSMVCILQAKERMAIQRSAIFLFFVGDEDERLPKLGHAFLGKAIEQLPE